jgi:CHASE1-domain containing sensor protein
MNDERAFEEHVIEQIEKAQRRHVLVAMLPLLLVIGLLIALGATATVFSIKNARGQAAASKADVQRNAILTQRLTDLTQQLKTSQESDAQSAVVFRNDSRRLLLALCDQIEQVALQAHLNVPPCPRVPAPS